MQEISLERHLTHGLFPSHYFHEYWSGATGVAYLDFPSLARLAGNRNMLALSRGIGILTGLIWFYLCELLRIGRDAGGSGAKIIHAGNQCFPMFLEVRTQKKSGPWGRLRRT